MIFIRRLAGRLLAAGLLLSPGPGGGLCAEDQGQRVPDEFESTGGLALGLGNGGIAANTGLSAVRNNPAMLALDKQYTVSAGYHWPSLGRDFWQAGAVDSQTSPTSAGLLYSAGKDSYDPQRQSSDKKERIRDYHDAPLKYRVVSALARPMGTVAVGLGLGYIEGYTPKDPDQPGSEFAFSKGLIFGFGLAGMLTPALRFSGSVENFSNHKLRDLAPKTWRGGLSFGGLYQGLMVNLDYRQRQRVYQERMLPVFGLLSLAPEGEKLEADEKLLAGSFIMTFQDLIQILGAYGKDLSGTGRRIASGGFALVNKTVSLSWLAGKPYLSDERLHQAVNLSLRIAI